MHCCLVIRLGGRIEVQLVSFVGMCQRYDGDELQLDLGAYSRNREINRDSSFSVLG